MWLNEEARIAQVANINQLPGTNGFTSSPKDAAMNTASFFRVELSILIDEKSLYLVGLEPATFRLQASTLTHRPLDKRELNLYKPKMIVKDQSLKCKIPIKMVGYREVEFINLLQIETPRCP